MSKALDGYSILVTRPEVQAVSLAAAIKKQGGQPLVAPMITIKAPLDETRCNEIIDQLGAAAIAIFISRHAVEFGCAAMDRRNQTLDGVEVFAVGVGTASELHAHGVADVKTPRAEFSSEGLLSLDGLQAGAIEGKHVVVFRGVGGREVLAETLLARGAVVDYCEIYERNVAPTCIREVLSAEGVEWPDIGVVTSLEVLTNLADKIDEEGLDKLYDIPLLAIGSRVAREVEKLGFTEEPVIVDNPSNERIVEALIRWVMDEI